MIEYVKLGHSEQIYGKKNLLYGQMELLTIIKRYQEYKKLRKKELALKNQLRKKVNEMQQEMKSLDKLFPTVKHESYHTRTIKKTPKKRDELDLEIEEIRTKLKALQ
ncbi:MAG: hypothetical protein IIA87_00910 [Nanoarchaeota archaeon]|nr:hypothetical protein [Nanoarchaeota archaeon]